MLKDIFLKAKNDKQKKSSHSDEFLQDFIDFCEDYLECQKALFCQIVQLSMSRAKIPTPMHYLPSSNFDTPEGKIVAAQFDGPPARGMIKRKEKIAGFF